MLEFLVEAADVVLDVIINIFSAKRRKLKAQRKAEETGGTSEHTEDEQGQYCACDLSVLRTGNG